MRYFTYLFCLLSSSLSFIDVKAQSCTDFWPLPYYQGFETTVPPALPPCTVNQTLEPYPISGDSSRWAVTNNAEKVLYIKVRNGSDQYHHSIWFFLPKMFFDAGRMYKLSFKYKYGGPNPNPGSQQAPQLTVSYGNCASSSCMNYLITQGGINNSTFLTVSKTFTPPNSGNYHIGFHSEDQLNYPGEISVLDSMVVQDITALPVSLSALNFTTANGGSKLSWQTFTETNNLGFNIEQSKDGNQFYAIGFVTSLASGGNSNSNIAYEYSIPANIINRGRFFRLRQNDRNGRTSYSNIVNIPATGTNMQPGITINGNPVGNILSVSINSPQRQQTSITITDNTGRTVINSSAQVGAGLTQLQVNVARLAAGNYYITVTNTAGNPIAKPILFTKQ